MADSKILVSLFVFNEAEKLKNLLEKFPIEKNYDLLFVDDASTDGSFELLVDGGYNVIRHESNIGIGAGIRDAINFGRNNSYDIIVIMSANGKMIPDEIPRLINPIINDDCDYIQGSRYLKGGQSPNLPLFRTIMIRLFTGIVKLATGYNGTDVTCGFRAYKLSLFDDTRFRIDQKWLDQYEKAYYVHYPGLKGG